MSLVDELGLPSGWQQDRALRNSYCREWARRDRAKNPGKATVIDRQRWKRPHRRDWWLKKKFGISLKEYTALLETQGGGCAICGGGPTGKQVWLSVDHDHATGVIRGLLCHSCNAAIGMLKDDPALCKAAGSYLESAILPAKEA